MIIQVRDHLREVVGARAAGERGPGVEGYLPGHRQQTF